MSSLAVTWTASVDAASYQVFRDVGSGGAFTTRVYAGAGTSYTDTGLTSNTTYYYKAQATNDAGSSALSLAASGTTASEAAPPSPTGLAAGGATPTSLSISWNASAGATGYEIFRDTSAAGTFTTQAYTGAATSFTDNGLSSGTTYYYKAQATSADGSSLLSAAVSGATVLAVPAGLAVGSPTLMALTVSWSASSGATSYQVFRDASSTGAFTTQVYNGSSLAFTDTPLNSSTACYYKVRAANAVVSSALSAAVSGTTSPPSSAGCMVSCHNASVPPNPLGQGKHTWHINSVGLACDKCHHNYQTQPTHASGTLNTSGLVFFDSSNPTGVFNYSTSSCSSLSCHGSRTW